MTGRYPITSDQNHTVESIRIFQFILLGITMHAEKEQYNTCKSTYVGKAVLHCACNRMAE